MATTNYNLPTISGASPVAIVDDYNALANATDAALAGAISGEKTRAMAAETELANGVSNALTTASSANVSASYAKSAADKAQTTASTALNNAATAQTTADGANTLASTAASGVTAINKHLSNLLNFDVLTEFKPSFASSISGVTVAINKEKTLYKLYGLLQVPANTTIPRVAIPGDASGQYGVKIDCGGLLATAEEAYSVIAGGIYMYHGNVGGASQFRVGTDGNAYLFAGGSSSTSDSIERYMTFPSCLYVNANFGDTPTPHPDE